MPPENVVHVQCSNVAGKMITYCNENAACVCSLMSIIVRPFSNKQCWADANLDHVIADKLWVARVMSLETFPTVVRK